MKDLTDQELKIIKKSMFGDYGIYKIKNGIPETIYISNKLHLACGMTREEFLSYTQKDATGVVLPSDRQKVVEEIQHTVEPGKHMDIKYRILVKNKGFLWVRARGHVCGKVSGYPVLIVSYVSELDNANNFKAILDNLDCAIYVRDKKNYEILYVNKDAIQFARQDADISKHTTCYQFFFGLDKPCHNCILPKSGNAMVSKDLYLEQKQSWLHVSVATITLGGHEAFIVSLRDITKQ